MLDASRGLGYSRAVAIQGKVKRSFYNTFDHPFRLEKLEPVVCDFCRSGTYRLVTKELGFEVRECRGCGMVYVSPQPAQEELGDFYEAMSPRRRRRGRWGCTSGTCATW